MSGGIEGERPRGELTNQQNSPQKEPQPQQEGSNGLPGLPPTLHERAKPQQDSPANNPTEEKKSEKGGILSKMREEIGGRSGMFEHCIIRDLMPSPQDVERRLKEGTISEERAKQALRLNKEIRFRANLTEMIHDGLLTREEYNQRLNTFIESPDSE